MLHRPVELAAKSGHSAISLDHLVGANKQCRRNAQVAADHSLANNNHYPSVYAILLHFRHPDLTDLKFI